MKAALLFCASLVMSQSLNAQSAADRLSARRGDNGEAKAREADSTLAAAKGLFCVKSKKGTLSLSETSSGTESF